MAAIFRVKRRNDDEPLDALVVACKRQKTESVEEATSAALSTVVKFAGTVKDQDTNVYEHITKKLSKEELKSNFKHHIVNITDKVRKETKEASAENRFKVVNHFRSLDNTKTVDSDPENITVIDIEDTASCTTKKDSEKKEDYVYDLYYTTNEADMVFDNFDRIVALEDALVFESYKERGLIDSDDNDESENSNSESNWRNDYPDSDHSEDSIMEDQMREAVEHLKIAGEESDLSSEDDDFAYGLDENDVDYFGTDYAKFKARMKKEWGDDESEPYEEELSESEGVDDLTD